MNKTKQIFINCIAIATLLLATSCEKELYDEAIKTNTSTGKSKPNIKVSSLNFTRNHPTIQKISQKTKSKLKTSRTNSIETNTLEAYFGEVKLDYGVEIIDSLNRKTTTFEVKETTVNPNEYYNFVIQNDSEFWLYKIEKLESTYKNYPANSTIVSRYSINENLTMSSPCDTIVFPPFGEMISEVIPSGTGGGSVSIGNINNPTEGGGFGFGLGVGYGSGYFNGLGPGSGGSGGGPSSGGNGASGQSLALIQIEDFLSDAWNWIRNLFSGGCNCGNRTSNRGAEEDLIVNSGGVVLEIKDSTVDCGEGGYVFITPQDEYVDKILEFENYFTYLHNNDRVFLYNNHHIVDYLYTLIQQNSNNANLMTILPELINKTRKGEITWEFAKKLINFISNNQIYSSNVINFLISENWSNESVEFTNYAIDVFEANPNANPLIGADCRSFEFAQPPGATKKGCAVINFNHTFYTAGVFPNGSPYFGEIDSVVPIAYFTMPSWMTNGRAANLTAKAVTFAIKATDLYYAANPTVSEVVLGQYFSNRLSHFLNAVGGTVSTSTPPFSIPSPAPYITSLIGISNPYDCE